MILSNLTVAYEDKIVLESIDLKCDSHFIILGANGSGKSTLAKAISALLPYHGSIKIDGMELKDMEPKYRAKKIAYIPSKMQNYEQFTTVEEFVLLGRYPYKSSFKDYCDKDKKIVVDTLNELKIQHLAHYRVDTLSSGEQQLVLIAQVLAQESKYIIFDEPTANLDPKNTQLFLKEFKKLRQKHKVILITHDIQLAHYLNDPILFVKNKKTKLYKSDFFKLSRLNSTYEVNFKNENGIIGIAYE